MRIFFGRAVHLLELWKCFAYAGQKFILPPISYLNVQYSRQMQFVMKWPSQIWLLLSSKLFFFFNMGMEGFVYMPDWVVVSFCDGSYQ